MKKYAVTFILLGTALGASAQLQKGSNMLNGSISFNQNKTSNFDTAANQNQNSSSGNGFSLGANYGRFIKDNIMAGVYASYYNSFSKNTSTNYGAANPATNTNKNTFNSYSAGVFGRAYKFVYKDKIALFGHVSLGYGVSTVDGVSESESGGVTTTYKSNSRTNSIVAGISPGITYFINKTFAIETSFGYANYSYGTTNYYKDGNVTQKQSTSNFGSNLRFSISSLSFGLNFYFGGKPKE